MQVGRTLSPDEFWAQYAATEERMRSSFGLAPILQLTEWSGARLLGEWEYEGPGRALVHREGDREITVRTGAGDPERAVREQWLRTMLAGSGGAPDLARFALQPPILVHVAIDGADAEAQLWRGEQHWFAAFAHQESTVVVDGTGEPPAVLSLERVIDLEPLLAARRREIEDQRRSLGSD